MESKILKEARRIESGMYFSVGGGAYYEMTVRRLIRQTLDLWLVGDASTAELHDALNCWEDQAGGKAHVVRACDDLRFMLTLDDWDEREGYRLAVWPRVREAMATLAPEASRQA